LKPKVELGEGSDQDRAAAREWIPMFLSDVVVRED
jgi:hypothetical protein